MKRRGLPGLIVLNAVLLALLAAVTLSPDASAQGRRRGSYVAVGGTINGTTVGVLYIVDELNQEVVAMQWNEQQGKLVGLGYRNMQSDMASGSGGASR